MTRNRSDTGRTIVGSVVCLDLVGYSRRSVAQQDAVKASFNHLLAQAIRKVPADNRIILDTGDGAAITFLGDPEECLRVGLELRDALNAAGPKLGAPEGPVRIGINLGPVKLSHDVNGHPIIVGDGMNAAERIAAFAKPGQAVVSRSFHDVVSRLSDAHATLFQPEGPRTDKNGRQHEIYSIASRPAPLPEKRPRVSIAALLRSRTFVGAAASVLVAIIGVESWFLVHRQKTQANVAAAQPAPVPGTETREAAKPLEPPPRARETIRSGPATESPAPRREERGFSALTRDAQSAARFMGSTARGAISSLKEGVSRSTSIFEASTATPVSRAPLYFPPLAAREGLSTGTVHARATVDANGNVTNVRIISSDPPRVFDREAIRSLSAWKFDAGADHRSYDAHLEFHR